MTKDVVPRSLSALFGPFLTQILSNWINPAIRKINNVYKHSRCDTLAADLLAAAVAL